MRLSNTLTRSVDELPPPQTPIGMYFCGPTVYQRIHVGNARPYVVSMWLKHWLERRGHDVTLVENITDINDKIYEAAPGRSAKLAAQAAQWYVQDTTALGLGRPDHEPKASESVPEIIALIEELVAREVAYEAGGDVYFRVARYPEYGRLSGQLPGQVKEQEPNPLLKEDPRDFALWKAHKADEDTWWDSPWGRGRPGWHIECSAMAERYLGPEFWIHGGGLDLVFPHHENELAQSRAAGRPFARVWMHNGLLRLTGEKMSKSLGNVASLQSVLEEWGRETLLLFFMTAHWSKPIDFSDETMAQARAQWESFANAVVAPPPERSARPWEAFAEALDNDFNTPDALAILHEWRAAGQIDLLRRGLDVFRLELAREPPPEQVQRLAEEREAARWARDFARADELRDEIAGLGWGVRDSPDGPVLVPKR